VQFVKYCYGDQMGEDGLGRACSTGGIIGKSTKLWSAEQKGGGHLKDLDVDGRIILE
jgi:hypothetical protein